MKQEVEVAMRLLEKDSHDKQDLVSSLRKQLEDVKNINIEMHSRLQVNATADCCSASTTLNKLSCRYLLDVATQLFDTFIISVMRILAQN